MIIMLIGFTITFATIIGMLVELVKFNKAYKRDEERKEKGEMYFYRIKLEDTWYSLFGMLCVISLIMSFPFGVAAIKNNAFYYTEYQRVVAERETIVKHLESETYYVSILGNDGKVLSVVNYIEKAYTFNAKIKSAEYYGNNAFTSWFYNKGVRENAQELYIDIENYFNV